MKCPYCGTDNPAGETFCTNCGGYLDANASGAATMVGGSTPGSATGSTGSTTTGGGTINSGTLTPNARLQQGRYVVEKILGQGGMGAAVLAKDTRVANKRVVIKELITDSSDPTQRQEEVHNFQREVATLAELDHPLIPKVTDSFQEGSRDYMVQEYAAGENLENMIERLNKPMPESEVLAYASQVLDILHYLAEQKPPIVHRDIKPANIIIGSKDKRARLVDFGIARADEAKNAKRKQTSALGTPGYAPPEQYQGNADARSDLYALAATMHHLLTNRDPRNYPPFNYPPVRTLNPQLTPEIERVLEKALAINVTQRYQSATEMKQDIDEILTSHFSVPADTSSYMLSKSGPMTAPRPVPTQQHPAPAPKPIQPVTPPPPPPPPPPRQRPAPQPAGYSGGPQRQVGAFGSSPARSQQSGGGYMRASFAFLVVVVIIVGVVFFVLPRLGSSQQTGGTNQGGTAATVTLPSNGIGVNTVNGEQIGISDGTYALDTGRTDGQDKVKASQAFANKDLATAQSLWHAALASESNDAEPLIYLENQRVLTSGHPYITIVIATMLTGQSSDVGTGRDDLQGAYVLQKEFNANNGAAQGGTMLRLLIASSGSSSTNAGTIAQQIVQAAKADSTIIGVMGWPHSGQTVNAVNTLSAAKIPMVSSTASSDQLSGISPYFFRVAPPDTSQAKVGAQYAKQKLNATNVAVFQDQSDAYSQSLAQGFTQQFQAAGGKVIAESYTKGNADSIRSALRDALSRSPAPDLIYFAGYSNDVSTILEELPKNSNFPHLQVLGGDALYNLGYPQSAQAGFSRLHFTDFAYPDEWSILGFGSKQPAFFTDYANAFDPNRTHQGSPYGFTRATYDATMSYDATLTLATAAKNALAGGKKTITPTDVQQALSNINGAHAIQGASGQIAFDQNGDPVNKAVIILYVDPNGHIQMEPQLGAGHFLVQQ